MPCPVSSLSAVAEGGSLPRREPRSSGEVTEELAAGVLLSLVSQGAQRPVPPAAAALLTEALSGLSAEAADSGREDRDPEYTEGVLVARARPPAGRPRMQ